MEFIDIHAHVNFAAYDKDREEVLTRAKEASVGMLNVGTQLGTSKSAVTMAQEREGVYAVVGLHPTHTGASHHDVQELGEGGSKFTSQGEVFDYEAYKLLAACSEVVAIGECGLDYYRLDESSKRRQKEVFEKQIHLANEVGKPLMLHIRNGDGGNAYADALEILKSEAKVEGDVHFFAGDWQIAKQFLDLGFTLSFTGVITFARNYDEVVKNAPLDMIMSETDCPYITPTPYRGTRNEPIHVREVVKKIAELRNDDLEKVKRQLVQNAARVFSLTL